MPIIERKEERCSPDEGFLTLFTSECLEILDFICLDVKVRSSLT